MPLLTASNLTRTFPTQDILVGASFGLHDGERVGLVGANGAGKTTLMRMIAGLDEPNRGTIDYQRGLRVGYLPQVAPEIAGDTLWSTMLEVFKPLFDLEKQLADLTHAMAEEEPDTATVNRYAELQHQFEAAGGYAWEHRVEAVLTGLGFPEERWQRPVGELSGGWRTRALLARLLLDEPDLLLLDEPTNNLDLDAVCWLEQFLLSYRGNLLLVSHDRFFLDRLCNRVWEIGYGRIETYKGNYTAYRTQRQERYDRRLKEWEAQQAYIEKEEDFIRRNIAGQRTKEAQGRRTKLERYLEENPTSKPEIPQTVRFRFNAAVRTGDMVLEARDLEVGYEAGKTLATVANLRLERGDRLAIIGPNGTGKSTLLKTLLGELAPLGGEFRWGANVETGYLHQHHDNVGAELTLVDAIREVQATRSDAEARSLLGALHFSGDEAFKQVGDLSGGQRARLSIARLAYPQPNVLLLDEPTNHLDIATMEALQEALLAFEGTLLVVSHDRYLVDAVAKRLLVIEDGTATLFEGTWHEWLEKNRQPAPEEPATRPAADTPPEDLSGKARFQADKRRENDRKRLQKRHDEVETQLFELEDEKKMLEHALGKAGENQDLDAINELNAQYQAVSSQVERLYDEWAKVSDHLERLS